MLALVGATAIWGSTFPISKHLITRLPVVDYLGLRFLIAAGAVLMVRPRLLRRLDRGTWVAGGVLGLLYTVAQLVQYLGLRTTPPTVAAFVVAMYVVFTPLLSAAVLRRPPERAVLVATATAVVGIGTMSLRGWSLHVGEALTLVAALLYAVHLLATGRWAGERSALALAFVQLLTMAVCFLGLTGIRARGVQLPTGNDWWAFAYLAVGAAAVTLLVQTWAQSRLDPSRTAVLMVLEPVWAGVFAFLLLGQRPDLRTVSGAVLIVGAMILAVGRRAARPVIQPVAVEVR